nr:Gfo/Idh/MocA family oxidoreductase [Magnetospirillum sulfuroxidans]
MVVGYGSIGQRHARLLGELDCEVAVVCRRPIDFPHLYCDLATALSHWQPDYVVIASSTGEHANDICILAEQGFNGMVLVEKPLTAHAQSLPPHQFSHGFVAYNLRFHPLLQAFHQRLSSLHSFTLHVTCGSYLPDWRPLSDYRKGYSALKALGGGVLRDLSHELDYTLWMSGGWTALTAAGGHLSNLQIDSDDVFSLLLQTPHFPVATVTLDYVDSAPRRLITALTNEGTLRADLINGTLEFRDDILLRVHPGRDDTYIAQHRAVLDGLHDMLCSLDEGEEVMRVIDAAERAATHQEWVKR